MNKKITMPELVELLAQKQNCTKREAENFVRELLALMTETISSGEILRISGLGVFKPVWVEERASINVQSGERTIIPGHYKLTFTPAKAVREAVNEPFACFCVEELPDDAPIVSEPSDVDEMGDDNIEEEVEVTMPENTLPEQIVAHPIEVEQISIEQDFVEQESQEEQKTAHSTEEETIAIVAQNQEMPETKTDEVVVEDTTPSIVAEDTEIEVTDSEKNTSKAYFKGVWMGVLATVVVFVVAIVLLLLCFPTYRDYLSQLPEYADSFFAGREPQMIEEIVDVESVVIDSMEIDTVEPVVIEPVVVPVVIDTIRRGVFLTNMSYKHYGHKAFWVYIYEENRNVISNPDNVPVGTVITIPPAQKYGIDVNDTTAINVALEKAALIKQRMRQ